MTQDDGSENKTINKTPIERKNFFESTVGKVVLGFLFTTFAGGFLNYFIQRLVRINADEQACNARVIEDRSDLQRELLEVAAKRYHLTGMVFGKLDDDLVENQDKDDKNYAKDYWLENLTEVKDLWNEKVTIYHSQIKLMYGYDTADLLIAQDKNLHSKYWYQSKGETPPSNVQEAFEHAHETAYYLAFLCDGRRGGCDRAGKKVKASISNAEYPSWDIAYDRLTTELIVLNKRIKVLSDELIKDVYSKHDSCDQAFFASPKFW